MVSSLQPPNAALWTKESGVTPGHGSGQHEGRDNEPSPEKMDILYFYKKVADDFEIRHSLRSVEQHAPWARKIWIYGDRPDFLTSDVSVAEHVPDSFATEVLGVRPPVRNTFQMLFLTSLLPELTPEYVWWSDDHFLLKDYPINDARKVRYLEDLRTARRPTNPGLWLGQLWHTHDTLKRLGYTGHNYETHTPIYFTKRRVLEAYCDLRDFVTYDRWHGLMGASAILNHAHRYDKMPMYSMAEEGSRVGWAGNVPPSYDDIIQGTTGKTFLFVNDENLTDATRQYLTDRYPERSRFEGDEPASADKHPSGDVSVSLHTAARDRKTATAGNS
jgi:hypothetical protein